MISAKNYAAQAEKSLLDQSKMLLECGFIEDSKKYLTISTAIKNSIKFVVPDGGLILDDNLKGLNKLSEVKLPYDSICIEFLRDKVKYVILAIQTKDGIVVYDIVKLGNTEEWVGNPHQCTIPYKWTYEIYENKESISNVADVENPNNSIVLEHFSVVLPSLYELLCSKIGKKKANDLCLHFLTIASHCVLGLCEALSCANIVIEPLTTIDKKKNEKRIKAGKLPLYETKILTIKTPAIQIKSDSKCGSHASPRQHLRRGHIRRYPNKNIWINACIVGDPMKGVINKSYVIK